MFLKYTYTTYTTYTMILYNPSIIGYIEIRLLNRNNLHKHTQPTQFIQ